MAVHTKNRFPQAIPYHSSKDIADRWRRRAHGMIIVTIGAIAVAIAAVVIAVKEGRGAANRGVDAAPTMVVPVPTVAAIEPVDAPVLVPVPKKLAEPPRVEPSQKGRFLEALGSLSVAHLYQSYLNIGLLADGVESETYTPKEAEDTLRSITDVMDQVDDQLGKLTKDSLDSDDAAALAEINAISVMLRLQSKFLQDYWKSDDKTDADKYHEVRKAAWTGLQKIMNAPPPLP